MLSQRIGRRPVAQVTYTSPMQTTVSIGEFSRLSHLTVKALRHYHQIDLFVPAEIDTSSGYRRYSTEQLGDAHLIRRLRDLAMPLPEIQTILSSTKADKRNQAIVEHLGRVEKELRHTKNIVTSLQALLTGETNSSMDVEFMLLPPLTVLSVTDSIEQQMILEWCGANFEPLYQNITNAGLVPCGPPGGLYSPEVLRLGEGEVTIFVPVLGSPGHLETAGAVTLESIYVASTTHVGPYDDLDRTYGQLGAEVNELGISSDGAIREVYVVGPVHSSDTQDWRTQVCWPVHETKDVS